VGALLWLTNLRGGDVYEGGNMARFHYAKADIEQVSKYSSLRCYYVELFKRRFIHEHSKRNRYLHPTWPLERPMCAGVPDLDAFTQEVSE